MAYSFGSLDSD